MDTKQVKTKGMEISQRFALCAMKLDKPQRSFDCPSKHYYDAKSIIGTIEKNQRVTRKQEAKLYELSFMLFEWPHPKGKHFC